MNTIHRLLCLVIFLTLPASAQNFRELNRSDPGALFEVKQYLDSRRLNIVVFSSRHSDSSVALVDKLRALAVRDPTLAVGVLDVDRKDTSDVDWKSPLARQYNLRVVPYVYIFDKDRNTLYQGHQARKKLLEYLDKAGL